MPDPTPRQSFFVVPPPIAKLFKLFPISTYPPNDLPARSPPESTKPTLYIFARPESISTGAPSFNPSCLKWQTFLKIAGIDFHTVSSNNHASPSGALPFLLPTSTSSSPAPITTSNLLDYASTQATTKLHSAPSRRADIFTALIDTPIRTAWLYALYLSPKNTNLLKTLYVHPASTSTLIRSSILRQLRCAAEEEILTTTRSAIVDPGQIYASAEEAFRALSGLLGEDTWFFACEGPTLFDASVFAYTHLLLDDSMAWGDEELRRVVGSVPNLVSHRERMLKRLWGEPVEKG